MKLEKSFWIEVKTKNISNMAGLQPPTIHCMSFKPSFSSFIFFHLYVFVHLFNKALKTEVPQVWFLEKKHISRSTWKKQIDQQKPIQEVNGKPTLPLGIF